MLDTIATNNAVSVRAALHPLKTERVDFEVLAGASIAEIFEQAQPDEMLRRAAHIYIGDYYIPRENWHLIRPKAGALVSVRAFVPPAGGGSGKETLRSVLLIAVAAAALVFAAPLAGAVGLTGAFGTAVGQAVIGIGGMLLVNALIPPRTNTPQAGDSPTKFIENARNNADPFGVVPDLFGYMKIVPKLAASWYTEIVGDDQYLRGLLTYGIGPVEFDPDGFKIGETALSEFDDVQVEHRVGAVGDAPITLYPATVDQQNFQITIAAVDSWVVRTSAANADEIGIDWVFPEGLIKIEDDGSRSNRTVVVQVEYSVAGANTWLPLPVADGTSTFPAAWRNVSGGTFNQVTFTQKRTNALRHGVTFKTPARAQYDIRTRRVTTDTTSDQIRDEVIFSSLRTFTNDNPIKSPVPVAVTAIRIKATDQLNGVIDEFSARVWKVCPDWDYLTSTWITRKTRNPASLFRYAMQSKALQVPYTDSQIDLVKLAYWHDFCRINGFEFGQWRDFTSSLYDLLSDIAAAGRASVANNDGKWSVVIDEPKLPVSHITPRNARAFEANKAFVTPPHAFRIQFSNEEQDWRTDELRVYINGYDETTATLFETAEFPGVNKSALLTKHARFNAAVATHRPEQFTLVQDMERLVYKRGDVVLLTYDVLLVGIASGRIKSVQLDGGGNAIGVTVDTPLPMDASVSYGLSIRTVDDAAVTAQLVTVEGEQTTLTFVSPILAANLPSVGDLFGFGELGQETDQALVIDIDPLDLYDARITAVPYREVVYTIDAGPIPPFDTKLTAIKPVPAVVVEAVRSDESVLTVGAGESLSVHVAVKVQPVTETDASLEVQLRPSTTGENYARATIDSIIANEAMIGDVRTGEYVDMRLRWIIAGRQPGDWTYIANHRVVGKSSDPLPLQGLTISAYNGQAFFRWEQPRELDVQFGGKVQFRHSEDAVPSWSNSTSIGQVAQARALFATLPLKTGTYLCRVYDEAGNQSTVVMIDSYQASVLQYIPVTTIEESPTFSGTKTNTILDGIQLKIGGGGDFDSIPDVDAEVDWDGFGGTSEITVGEYEFAAGFNFGAIKRRRITTQLLAGVFIENDLIDTWSENIDDRDNFDGADTSEADCVIYVSKTNDDPSGSPVWDAWQRLDSMEVECWGCKFKAIMTSYNADFNIGVTGMGVKSEEVL